MTKKKVDYLCYEARFSYVKTLDFAAFKYVVIYPLASFVLENGRKGRFRPNLEDCFFITKIGMATITTYLKSAKFEVSNKKKCLRIY